MLITFSLAVVHTASQMPSVLQKLKTVEYRNLLLLLLTCVRRIFGLQALRFLPNGDVELRTSQRVLAAGWLSLYAVSLSRTTKMNASLLGFAIKNSVITEVLPRIYVLVLVLNTISTFVLTHLFANERKKVMEDVLYIHKNYEAGGVTMQSDGTCFACIVALAQIFYESHLDAAIQHIEDLSFFDIIALVLPKIIAAMFLMEYVSTIVFMKQRYASINAKLRNLLNRSIAICRHYPQDEKEFQEQIMAIADHHRFLSKAGVNMSKIYSVQLLLNFGFVYASIIINSYFALYSMLSVVNAASIIPLIVTSILNVGVNGCTLLVLVEVTTQLYREVYLRLLNKRRTFFYSGSFYCSLKIQN